MFAINLDDKYFIKNIDILLFNKTELIKQTPFFWWWWYGVPVPCSVVLLSPY